MNAISAISMKAEGDAVPSVSMTPVTVITGVRPLVLSKSFSLSQDGKLEKSGGGILAEGEVTVFDVDGLAGLAKLLPLLTPSQALIYGVPLDSAARRGPHFTHQG